MREFKFVTWEAHTVATIKAEGKHSDTQFGELNEGLRLVNESDYKQITEYYLQHTSDGLQAEPNNEKLKTLKYFAEKVLKSESINDIAMACLNTGKAIAAFEVPTYAEQIEATRLQVEKISREGPLLIKNNLDAGKKEIIQQIARFYWENDLKNEIRLSEMTEKVWAALDDIGALKDMPFKKKEALKSWLRPVAHEFVYPSAQGRPKK